MKIITKENILNIDNPKKREEGHPVSGIYFLILNNEIVYIGRSKNCYIRIETHKKIKEFSDFKIIKINRNKLHLLPKLERYFIHKFNPALNKTNPLSNRYL